MLKSIELNKTKLRYITIKNYKNDLKQWKKLKELELLREKKNKWNKKTKIKLNVLNNEIIDVLKKFEFELEKGTLENRYCKKLNSCKDTVKLRLSSKEEINEIKKLRKEIGNNEDKLLNAETKIFELLTDSEYQKEVLLYDIMT